MEIVIRQADTFTHIRAVTDTDCSMFFLVFNDSHRNGNLLKTRLQIGGHFNRTEIPRILNPGLPVQKRILTKSRSDLDRTLSHNDIFSIPV